MRERWSREKQREIKVMRCSKGFLTMAEMAEAISKRGVEMGVFPEGFQMSKQSYTSRETGKVPCSTADIKVIADLLGISVEEAIDLF